MKKVVIAFLVVAAASFYSFVADSDDDKFARSVYDAVKTGQLEELKKHVITPEELNPVIDASTFSPEKKASMKKRLTQEFFDKETLRDHNEIQEKVKTENIIWETAIIDSVITKRETREGIDVLQFEVHFTSNKKQYAVSAIKIFNTKNGWKLTDGVSLDLQTTD